MNAGEMNGLTADAQDPITVLVLLPRVALASMVCASATRATTKQRAASVWRAGLMSPVLTDTGPNEL